MQGILRVSQWMFNIFGHIRPNYATSIRADLEAKLAQMREEPDSAKKDELKRVMVHELARNQIYSNWPDPLIAAYHRDLLDAYQGHPDQEYRNSYGY